MRSSSKSFCEVFLVYTEMRIAFCMSAIYIGFFLCERQWTRGKMMNAENENITNLVIDGKEIILIGTAHVSKKSAEEVKEVIETEMPDAVCIELDEQRFQSITEQNKWQNTDIFKVIKEKKATLLLMNLAISSFQKRMAKQFDVKPGQEMIQGIESAEEIGAELILADRNIQTTFSRIWRGMGLKGKAMLLSQIFAGIFSRETITEDELEAMKSKDMLDSMLQEFTEYFPSLKKPLVDERDQYLAHHIRNAPGEKIVAVVGAAHVPGIKKEINRTYDIRPLDQTPPKSKVPKLLAWMIPLLILGVIAYTFIANPEAGMEQTLSWIFWNSSLSALGAIIALGHPLAILTALIMAPLTSLTPVLAAGWFAGLIQAYVRRPSVKDFEALSEDVYHVKGFWNNKVTRILLIILLANLGSALGTVVAGIDVFRVFLDQL